MEEELDDTATRDEASEPKTSADETAESEAHFATSRELMTLLRTAATPIPASRAGLFQRATCQDKPHASAVSPCKAAQRWFRSSEVIIFQYKQPRGNSPHVTASQIRSQQCGAARTKPESTPVAKAGRAPERPSAAAPVPNAAPLPASESAEPRQKPSNWRKLRSIVQWTPFIQTYKKHKYPWVQLAGHQGNFLAGYKQGTILKKLCPAEEKALEAIKKDILRPYVPTYMGVVEGTDGERYLQLQDLLSDFTLPCVMDIKMGVRTYLEDELAKAREKPKLRKDMYEKMVQIDPKAPTEAENRAKAVTKPRYMVWRETISSTATQGFRIEGMRRGDGTSSKDFKTTRTREQVLASLNSFLQGYPHAASRYVQQLKSIKATLEASAFFKTHELIGSSLLFVHNESSASVKLIDFAKTIPLPENVEITHRKPWSEGTHEDGYLLGLDNLIDLFSVIEKNFIENDAITKTGTPTTTTNATTPEETSSSTSSALTTNTTTNTSSSNSNSTST
ncbi:inositol-trisphosphate 3-kinase A-like isoform X2 [Penaeus indicus]|uniref:inositol-trisphosphate 3-kinase A-like isoform X2 n=1 Tax=Penaeus indicus TaxID=29960 RepID=UPI00300CBD51